MRRVIQFSTANVGRHPLRTIIERPDLELVGVHATAARAVNMIEPVCTAPSGLLAAKDLPAAHIRGVMW